MIQVQCLFNCSGSTSSLIAGLVFGGLSGVGAYLYSQNSRSYFLLLGIGVY